MCLFTASVVSVAVLSLFPFVHAEFGCTDISTFNSSFNEEFALSRVFCSFPTYANDSAKRRRTTTNVADAYPPHSIHCYGALVT